MTDLIRLKAPKGIDSLLEKLRNSTKGVPEEINSKANLILKFCRQYMGLTAHAAEQYAAKQQVNVPVVRYYASVAMRNPDGKYLAIHHTQKSDHPWRFPGGKIAFDEDPVEAASRELQEELGITGTLHSVDQHTTDVDGGRWHGYYFLCTDWKGEPKLQEPEKQTCLAWLTAEQLAAPGINSFPEQLVAKKIDSLIKLGHGETPEITPLHVAVRDLYYAACWSSDRLDKDVEARLWTAVRDAAGLPPGRSPKPIEKQEAVKTRPPDGYAYRYPTFGGNGTVLRFNTNASPIEAIPYFLGTPEGN